MVMKTSIIFAIIALQSTLGSELPVDKRVARARVESCGGWRLNRLPEVKRFIFKELPLFHNAEFKQIGGASPELIYLNSLGEEIERVPLSEKTQIECRDLLLTKGFYMKKTEDDEVPEKFKDAPYNSPHQEL